MNQARERAAVVALLGLGRAPWRGLAERLEQATSAEALLREEPPPSSAQATLFDAGAPQAGALLDEAESALRRWEAEGFQLITVRDPSYPDNLREVHDRPPAIFVAGRLAEADARSVAVIGSRQASEDGLAAARTLSRYLVAERFVVVSGLAAGIDTAVHTAALAAGGRTVAVIGTGLRQSYPSANAALQAELARDCAVVSQFLPDAPPAPDHFRQRNAVMSGLTRGTVIVEASERSGTRVQARLALAHGRPVFLRRSVLDHDWAQEMSQRPGVHVIDGPADVTAQLQRLETSGERED